MRLSVVYFLTLYRFLLHACREKKVTVLFDTQSPLRLWLVYSSVYIYVAISQHFLTGNSISALIFLIPETFLGLSLFCFSPTLYFLCFIFKIKEFIDRTICTLTMRLCIWPHFSFDGIAYIYIYRGDIVLTGVCRLRPATSIPMQEFLAYSPIKSFVLDLCDIYVP